MNYLISLAVGLLVGVIYGLLNVRSPAPPAVALIGLLGILMGEQAIPVAKRLLRTETAATAGTGSAGAGQTGTSGQSGADRPKSGSGRPDQGR